MGRIRGKNTRPEILLRKALWRSGLRYRLHFRTPVGRPDIVFSGPKVAVFVDGCQWHGCPQHYVRPRTRTHFWASKLEGNVERDRRQTAELRHLGWRIIRVWEHDIFENPERAADSICRVVHGGSERPLPDWRVVSVKPLNESGSMERQYLMDLVAPHQRMVVERPRSTKKWTRKRAASP